MKKLVWLLVILCVFIGSWFAYDLTQEDEALLEKMYPKLDSIVEQIKENDSWSFFKINKKFNELIYSKEYDTRIRILLVKVYDYFIWSYYDIDFSSKTEYAFDACWSLENYSENIEHEWVKDHLKNTIRDWIWCLSLDWKHFIYSIFLNKEDPTSQCGFYSTRFGQYTEENKPSYDDTFIWIEPVDGMCIIDFKKREWRSIEVIFESNENRPYDWMTDNWWEGSYYYYYDQGYIQPALQYQRYFWMAGEQDLKKLINPENFPIIPLTNDWFYRAYAPE